MIRLYKEGYGKVDHDYVLGAAKLAKDGGAEHFHVISAIGASETSWIPYCAVKVYKTGNSTILVYIILKSTENIHLPMSMKQLLACYCHFIQKSCIDIKMFQKKFNFDIKLSI